MNTNTISIILLSSLFVVPTFTLIPNIALADDSNMVLEESDGWDSNNMEKLIAHTGREVIHHLIAAKQALQKNLSGKARGNLIAAQRLNYFALQVMPFLSVSEDIMNAKGKLAMEETDVYFDQLLPIYYQLDSLSLYAPEAAKKVRTHMEKSEKQARKGNSKAAMGSLDNAITVLSGTMVYMPVLYIEGQLKAALYGLNQPNRYTKMAIEATDNALNSLEVFNEKMISTPTSP